MESLHLQQQHPHHEVRPDRLVRCVDSCDWDMRRFSKAARSPHHKGPISLKGHMRGTNPYQTRVKKPHDPGAPKFNSDWRTPKPNPCRSARCVSSAKTIVSLDMPQYTSSSIGSVQVSPFERWCDEPGACVADTRKPMTDADFFILGSLLGITAWLGATSKVPTIVGGASATKAVPNEGIYQLFDPST